MEDPATREGITSYQYFVRSLAAVNLAQGATQLLWNHDQLSHSRSGWEWAQWVLGSIAPQHDLYRVCAAGATFVCGLLLTLLAYHRRFRSSIQDLNHARAGLPVTEMRSARARRRGQCRQMMLFVVAYITALALFLALLLFIDRLPYASQLQAAALTLFGQCTKRMVHSAESLELPESVSVVYESTFVRNLVMRVTSLAVTQWHRVLDPTAARAGCDAERLAQQYMWFLLSDATLGNLTELAFPVASKCTRRSWSYHIGYDYIEIMYRQFLVLLALPYAPQLSILLGVSFMLESYVDFVKIWFFFRTEPSEKTTIFHTRVLVYASVFVCAGALLYPTNPVFGLNLCPALQVEG